MLNLDTHILIYALDQDLLTHHERETMRAAPWGISAIVLWEIEMLFARGRIRYGLDHEAMVTLVSKIRVWPISREVCLRLRELDFRSDPADELIAATSLAHGVPLLTRDTRIRSSQLVRFA